MSIQVVQFQAMNPVVRPEDSLDKLASPMTPGKNAGSTAGESAGWAGLARKVGTYNNLVEEHQALSSVARSVRIADNAMGEIGKAVDALKTTLEGIVKNYPPFPPGSEERVKLLRSYSGIRKQIDQLTIPPDKAAQKIMADPGISGTQGWTIAIGSDGIVRTVRKEQVHTGPTGLNIPQLSENSSDTDVKEALDKLVQAKETLEVRRTNLRQDAFAIAAGSAARGGSGDVTEQGAKQYSVEARDGLSSMPYSLLNNWNMDAVRSLA